jgi:hypothetical protein
LNSPASSIPGSIAAVTRWCIVHHAGKIVFNPWDAYFRAVQTGWEASAVISMRLMRLGTGGALAQREAQRMVTEKVMAAVEAQTAAATAMMTGRGLGPATKSASAVYRRKVRANRRRLAGR